MPALNVALNAAVVSNLNSVLSGSAYMFGIGAVLSDPANSSGEYELIWNGSSGIGVASLNLSLDEPSPVPLPAALPLYGTGLGLMGLFGWWRRRRALAA